MSLSCAKNLGLPETPEAKGLRLLRHPSLSTHPLDGVIASIRAGRTALDLFGLKGAVIQEPEGNGGFHRLSEAGRPVCDFGREPAGSARHVAAAGGCAAFGGITVGGGNPTEVCGLQFDGDLPGGRLGEGFRWGRGALLSGIWVDAPGVGAAGCIGLCPSYLKYLVPCTVLHRRPG